MTQNKSETALAVKEVTTDSLIFKPEATFEELQERSEWLAHSKMVPKSYVGNPQDILVAVDMGRSLGLAWMASLQSIAVINGMPSVWGPGLMAIIQNSAECEYLFAEYDKDTKTGRIRTKRRGYPEEQSFEFDWDDAKTAGLAGKETYKKYPQNMLRWRALALCNSFLYSDLTKGLRVAEEAMDFPTAPHVTEEAAEDLTSRVKAGAKAKKEKAAAPAKNIQDAEYEEVDEKEPEWLPKTRAHLVKHGLESEGWQDRLAQLVTTDSEATLETLATPDAKKVWLCASELSKRLQANDILPLVRVATGHAQFLNDDAAIDAAFELYEDWMASEVDDEEGDSADTSEEAFPE